MISSSNAVASAPLPASTGQTPTALEEAQKTAASSNQGQKNLRNAQILEASLQVSIQSGNESLALAYRTAIEGINAVLEPELGPDAIQNAMSQEHSPQATAGRIVSLSTAMFDSYAAAHPAKDFAEAAKDFIEVIRRGFEQGFQEAQDILNSLGVLPDNQAVADGIAQTYALVQKGYEDWLNQRLTPNTGDAADTSNAPSEGA